MQTNDQTKLNHKNAFKRPADLAAAWSISFLASFAYIASEWLFLVTKPSSINALPVFEKIAIPIFSAALMSVIAALFQFIFWAIARPFRESKWANVLQLLIPAGILSATALLLIDNFTYTTLSFGIITSQGLTRFLYGLGFLLLIAFFVKDLIKLSHFLIESRSRKKLVSVPFVFAVMLAIVIIVLATSARNKQSINPTSSQAGNLKNVVLITADGLNAEQMSVYGFEKETTPFLDSIASRTLIAQNNFSNSGSTTGSLTSILTGKYPTTTRVLSRPDILRGEDSYQSLPAILKSLGYYSAQYSFGYYADAYAINFKNAFDFANGRTSQSNSLFGLQNLPIPSNYEYFLYELQNRLLPRLKHIFFIKTMENEFQQVNDLAKFSKVYVDREKIYHVIDALSSAEQPVFLHVHWMKTHGQYFNPRNRVFSEGLDLENQEPWSLPFYEDAILDFDEDLGFLYQELEKLGVLEDTLIIIGSDHASQFVTTRRIPLIFLFPEAQNSQLLTADTQNLDIAPTILDYLGIGIPTWMEGSSLLAGNPPYRPIIGVQNSNIIEVEEQGWLMDETFNTPPFYQFDLIGVQNCGLWTQLNLENLAWSTQEISSYQPICDANEQLSANQIRQTIIERLKKDGFEFDDTEIGIP